MVQTVSAWSRNATRGAEQALDLAREQQQRDMATARGDQRFKELHRQNMAKATHKAERVFATYGIDIRQQEKDRLGKRIWTEAIKRQVVRAAYSGNWTRAEIFQAVGVYNPELRKWAKLYPEETLPQNLAKAPGYSPLEQAIDKATTELTASTTTQLTPSTRSPMDDMTPASLNGGDDSPMTPSQLRKTNKQILELYGIDLEGLESNSKGRVFPELIRKQIIALIDSGRYVPGHVYRDLGINSHMIVGWRGKLAAGAGAGAAAAEPSPTDLAQVSSMAPQLAAGQLMKRQRRVANLAQVQEVSAVNTIKVEASTIAHAIGILELMRGNQEITRVSLVISVVE